MIGRRHLEGRVACPHLPGVEAVLTADETRRFRRRYDSEFYLAALRYAQSLWLEGKPAQSLLQLNKALMAEMNGREPVLLDWPLPYAAKRWVIENHAAAEFLGNPVRHYQHLATRMMGPRAELRTWRAWACYHLSAAVLPADRFPPDQAQIEREALVIPAWEAVLAGLDVHGLPGESDLVMRVVKG